MSGTVLGVTVTVLAAYSLSKKKLKGKNVVMPIILFTMFFSGGMIPKIDCCVEAVRRGVHRAHILDGRIPHSILIELFSDEGIGTMLY